MSETAKTRSASQFPCFALFELSERKNKEGNARIRLEGLDLCALTSQEVKDGLRPGITDREPDDLRGSAVEETELAKVVVLGDDRVRVSLRPFPDRGVCRTPQVKRTDMDTTRIFRFESLDEPGAQVLVEKQLHTAEELASRRSRSAAKARQVRMSSAVRSGKSARIWASVMPPARYSSTSYTVMRVPLMQGFPLRTPGLTVMRSCQRSMAIRVAPLANDASAPCLLGAI